MRSKDIRSGGIPPEEAVDPWALVRGLERKMRRDVRVMGLLVLLIAFILFLAGVITISTSQYAQERYEEPGGELLRDLSPEDQRNYESAQDSERFGGFLVLLSLITFLIGLILILKPGLYRWVMRDKVGR